MKKMALLVAVAVVALAFNAFAQVDVKTETKTTPTSTTEKTVVKDTQTGAKAEQKTTETATGTTTDTKIKGENVKLEKKTTDTAAGTAETGKLKVDVKKGAIKDLDIEWSYYQEGTGEKTNYILKYFVKENKAKLSALNLTPAQIAAVKPGEHTVVSTSPYTAEIMRDNFRNVVAKDIESSVAKAKK